FHHAVVYLLSHTYGLRGFCSFPGKAAPTTRARHNQPHATLITVPFAARLPFGRTGRMHSRERPCPRECPLNATTLIVQLPPGTYPMRCKQWRARSKSPDSPARRQAVACIPPPL